MDIFTMVIMACVAGEPTCHHARISKAEYVSVAACEAHIDETIDAMAKELGRDARRKGKAVAFDVSCMDRQQLHAKLGVVQTDL